MADLSYSQTTDSPCTIDLFDESTAGSCGEIVAWKWYRNGVPFSTAQNPTGIEVDDGDDITLEVTDAAGCTAGAVMEVICVPFVGCIHCDDPGIVPSVIYATLAGYVPFGLPQCPSCNLINTRHMLTSTGTCGWSKIFEVCGRNVQINVSIGLFVGGGGVRGISGTVTHGGANSYQKGFGIVPTVPCRGTHVLPGVGSSSGSGDYCLDPSPFANMIVEI